MLFSDLFLDKRVALSGHILRSPDSDPSGQKSRTVPHSANGEGSPYRQQWRHFTHRHAWKNLSDGRTHYDNTDQQNRQLNRSHTRFLSCRMKLDPLSRKHSPPAPLKLQCGFRAFAQGFPWLPDGCSRRRDRVQSLRPFGCIASTVSWSALSLKIHHKSILKCKWCSEFMAQLFQNFGRNKHIPKQLLCCVLCV